MGKATRERAKRRQGEGPKTKELLAKNVRPGHIVVVRGGLGIIDVAENDLIRGKRRISEAPTLRPGNRRKRRHLRRFVLVDPNTKVLVVK